MYRKICLLAVFAAALAGSYSATADVIYETSYTTRTDNGNSFVDGGELRFQDQWLGQMSFIVDSDAPGIVSSSGQFLRTLQGRGATGGTAGGDGSGETGAGFSNGDRIKVTTQMQYNLGTSANQALSRIGFRPNFVNGSFNASPVAGFKVAYSSFGGGSLKVYSNLLRQGFVGDDNAFAIFITGAEGGFDGADQGQMDVTTDNFEFVYEAVYNEATTSWDAINLSVTNLDTDSLVADAATENLAALESTTYAGTEAFYGQVFTDTNVATGNSDGMRFEFFAVPEPSSLAVLGLLAGGFGTRRKRAC